MGYIDQASLQQQQQQQQQQQPVEEMDPDDLFLELAEEEYGALLLWGGMGWKASVGLRGGCCLLGVAKGHKTRLTAVRMQIHLVDLVALGGSAELERQKKATACREGTALKRTWIMRWTCTTCHHSTSKSPLPCCLYLLLPGLPPLYL